MPSSGTSVSAQSSISGTLSFEALVATKEGFSAADYAALHTAALSGSAAVDTWFASQPPERAAWWASLSSGSRTLLVTDFQHVAP